jgi:hypothetical protein
VAAAVSVLAERIGSGSRSAGGQQAEAKHLQLGWFTQLEPPNPASAAQARIVDSRIRNRPAGAVNDGWLTFSSAMSAMP